jgi:hypothetical protein
LKDKTHLGEEIGKKGTGDRRVVEDNDLEEGG